MHHALLSMKMQVEHSDAEVSKYQERVAKLKSDLEKYRFGHVINLAKVTPDKRVFLSYSQCNEDFILFGVFSNITSGFYIDIGANNPIRDFVTKAFYEMGWTGINVEPLKGECERLLQDRPRDINLCIAVGDQETQLTLHERNTLSTLKKEEAAKWGTQSHTRRVDVVPLSTITDRYCVGHIIHFLKIDVEGFEREVLLGADFIHFRPQVIVIEATEPRSNIPTHQQWENILTTNGYEFALQEKVNRYYFDSNIPGIRQKFKSYDELLDLYVLVKYRA